jgi:hypothetical protein
MKKLETLLGNTIRKNEEPLNFVYPLSLLSFCYSGTGFRGLAANMGARKR